MSNALLMWKKIPVIIKAILTGLLVAALGTIPWSLLVSLNMKHGSALPWAVPITAVYLWFYWRYVRGDYWPHANSGIRKKYCRANKLSDSIWGAALLAGITGLVFIVLFQSLLARMVRLPAQSDQGLSSIPTITLFSFVIMSAVVAGVVEEVSFRGYMQSPIEKRHGPVAAILTVGIIFGLVHFTHPEVSLILLPYYAIVAAVYGALAYLTNSIFPSMVLHAGGNIFSSLGFFMTGRSEWQASAKPVPLIWETGLDSTFWISSGATLLMGAVTIWAYRTLSAVSKKQTSLITKD